MGSTSTLGFQLLYDMLLGADSIFHSLSPHFFSAPHKLGIQSQSHLYFLCFVFYKFQPLDSSFDFVCKLLKHFCNPFVALRTSLIIFKIEPIGQGSASSTTNLPSLLATKIVIHLILLNINFIRHQHLHHILRGLCVHLLNPSFQLVAYVPMLLKDQGDQTEYTSIMPAVPLQQVQVIVLKRYWPAVSQICIFNLRSYSCRTLLWKSTPIVGTWHFLKVQAPSGEQQRETILVLPTPESPIIITFIVQSQASPTVDFALD